MGKTGNRELREALPETLVTMRKETKAGSKTLVIYKKQNQSRHFLPQKKNGKMN